jgi:hypothetical protein
MTLEEFYNVIRHKNDPLNYSEVKDQLDDVKYAALEHKTLTSETRFYLQQFLNQQGKGCFISRNIPAIILGPVWFAYRRMYLQAIILFIINSLATILLYEYVVGDYIPFILNFVVGFFANALFFQNVKRRKAKGLSSEGSTKSWIIFLIIQQVITGAVLYYLHTVGIFKLF